MADNICFPAKLVHSHISNLIAKHIGQDIPCPSCQSTNISTTVPTVSIAPSADFGYSEVIQEVLQGGRRCPPSIRPSSRLRTLDKLVGIQCEVLSGYGMKHALCPQASREAVTTFRAFKMQVQNHAMSPCSANAREHQMCMLACRPTLSTSDC